ncbi:MAG: hypothetical protein ACREWG_03725 [Gammaproteobacteria bacterium]
MVKYDGSEYHIGALLCNPHHSSNRFNSRRFFYASRFRTGGPVGHRRRPLAHGPSQLKVTEEIAIQTSPDKVWTLIEAFCSVAARPHPSAVFTNILHFNGVTSDERNTNNFYCTAFLKSCVKRSSRSGR